MRFALSKDDLKINRLLKINAGKDVAFYLLEDNHDIISHTNKVKPRTARHFTEILD